MRGVADAEQSRPVPFAQTIYQYRQQLDLIPIANFVDAFTQERSETENVLAKLFQTSLFDFFQRALANDIAALPIRVAINHHHHLAVGEAPQSLTLIVRFTWQTKPQHIYRRAQTFDL